MRSFRMHIIVLLLGCCFCSLLQNLIFVDYVVCIDWSQRLSVCYMVHKSIDLLSCCKRNTKLCIISTLFRTAFSIGWFIRWWKFICKGCEAPSSPFSWCRGKILPYRVLIRAFSLLPSEGKVHQEVLIMLMPFHILPPQIHHLTTIICIIHNYTH